MPEIDTDPPPPHDAPPQGSGAPTAVAAGQARASLDRSLVKSLAWTGSLSWLSQVVTWVATIAVARMLTPQDYGLVSMATVILGLFATVSEFGIQSTIVVMRDLDDRVIAQLNSVVVLSSGVAGLVVIAVAHPLAAFFSEPDLVWVVYALSASFLVAPLSIIPIGLLQRDLRFKLLALIQGGRALVMGLLMIGLAVAGFRYWTLVIGNLTSAALVTVASVYFRPHGFARPVWRDVAGAIRLSSAIIANRISWYVYSNSDFLIAGRRLGPELLGAYTLTWSVANIPVEKVTALVTSVTPSYFSAVQKDVAALRRYFLRITEGLAFITLPAGIGLALVTSDFVRIAFGDPWLGMIGPLRLLALYGAFRSLVTLHPHILTAVLDANFPMRVGLAMALVMPAAFYFGSQWGPTGIAMMWIGVYPFLTIPLYWRVFRRLELSLSGYLRALWPALSSCLIMAVFVVGLGLVADSWPVVARFVAQVVLGAAAYLSTIYFGHRDRFTAAVQTIRRR